MKCAIAKTGTIHCPLEKLDAGLKIYGRSTFFFCRLVKGKIRLSNGMGARVIALVRAGACDIFST